MHVHVKRIPHRDPRKRPNSEITPEITPKVALSEMTSSRTSANLELAKQRTAKARLEVMREAQLLIWAKMRNGKEMLAMDLARLARFSRDTSDQTIREYARHDDDVIQLARCETFDYALLLDIVKRRSGFRRDLNNLNNEYEANHLTSASLAFDLQGSALVLRKAKDDWHSILGMVEMAIGQAPNPGAFKTATCFEWYAKCTDEITWSNANIEALLCGISFYGNALDIVGYKSMQNYFFQCEVSWPTYKLITRKLEQCAKESKPQRHDPIDDDYYNVIPNFEETNTCQAWFLRDSIQPELPTSYEPNFVGEMPLLDFFYSIPVLWTTYKLIMEKNPKAKPAATRDYMNFQKELIMKSRREARLADDYDPCLEFNHFQPAVLYNSDLVRSQYTRPMCDFFQQSKPPEIKTCHEWYTSQTYKFEPTRENFERAMDNIGFVGNMMDILGCGSRKNYFFQIPVSLSNYRSIMKNCVLRENEKLAGDATI
jgi:hypothetical protein